MTDEEWLNQIATSPYDANLREAYAAWLYKQGRRNCARLIRLASQTDALEQKYRPPRRVSQAKWRALRDAQGDLLLLSYKVDSRWLVRVDPRLSIPSDLPELGRKAANIIIECLGTQQWDYEGGISAFERLEDASEEVQRLSGPAVLVVNLSDEALQMCFGTHSRAGSLPELLADKLHEIGAWYDFHDCFTAVIHPKDYPGLMIGFG
jgi:uncharacterized protein (TIGR02996 family)